MPSFEKKDPRTIADQLSRAEKIVGAPLNPPHLNTEAFRSEISDLKARFPKRYALYLDILRREKQGSSLDYDSAIRMKNWLTAMNGLDRYIHEHHHDLSSVNTLTEHQVPVLEAIRDYFEGGGAKGYVKLPTGSGKTVIFTELIEAMELRTLIVVPRKILLTQTVEKMEQFAGDLDVGRVYSDAKEHGRQVTVITYDSLVSGLKSGFIDPKNYDLLVLDEVHRALSEKRKEVVGRFDHALQIGFTATPRYSSEKQVTQILAKEIYSLSIKSAVEKGLLCSFSAVIAQTDVDLSSIKIDAGGDYDEEELNKAINIETRNRAAVQLYIELFSGKKAIAYCLGIKHSEDVAKLFTESGIKSALIHGSMGEDEQRDILKKYKSGEIKVLCNADLLIEGFDDAEASVCLNLRPTKSYVVAEQRGGRVTRIDRKNSKKHSFIVDFVDEFGDDENAPITFAEVAEGVYFRAPLPEEGSNKEGSETKDDLAGGYVNPENDDNESGSRCYLPKKDIDIKGLKVIVDVNEVMRIVNEAIERKDQRTFETAPDGWISLNALSDAIGSARHSIRNWISEYKDDCRNKHKPKEIPESFFQKNYLAPSGHVRMHYAPHVVEFVRTKHDRRAKAPPGWRSVNALMGELKKSRRKIESDLEDLIARRQTRAVVSDEKDVSSEIKKKFLDEGSQLREHYSPEICEELRKLYVEVELAPANWFGVNQVARDLGKDRKTLVKMARKILSTLQDRAGRDSSPDPKTHLIGEYLDVTKNRREHYSSVFVALLKRAFAGEDINMFEIPYPPVEP